MGVSHFIRWFKSPARAEGWAVTVLATPLALTYLAGIAMGTTDIIMIGWLGPEPLAAAALAGEFYGLFYIVGVGILTAVSPMIAHALGARRYREVRRAVRQGLWAAVVIALPVGLVVWHAGDILPLLGQDPAIATMGEAYVRAVIWGFLPSMGFVVLRNFVAAHHRPRSALVVISLGIVVNIIADYILIFGHFGFPRLELFGAGIASSVVCVFMFAGQLGFVLRDRRFRRYQLLGRWWRPDWPRFQDIFRIGGPIGVMSAAEIGVFLAATFLMGLFGTTELAAHAIALQCGGLAFAVPFSLGQAATIRVAYAAGAGDVAALRLTSRVAISLGMVWSIVGCALLWWLAAPIAGVFLDAADPANLPTLEMAVALVAFVAFYQLPDGPQQVALGVLRGLRDTRVPMIIALISYWIIGAALCVWFGFGLGFGGPGVWAGLALALVIATMAVMTRYLWCGERLAAVAATTST
jgi:MATE family multidrug resistance protein